MEKDPLIHSQFGVYVVNRGNPGFCDTRLLLTPFSDPRPQFQTVTHDFFERIDYSEHEKLSVSF